MEITSRYKGNVSKIFYDPGDIVKVGETLLKMVVDEPQTSTVLSDGLRSAISINSDTSDSSNHTNFADEPKIGGLLSTPAVRNLAKKYGVYITDIHGTGKDGRVLKDVLKYAASKGMCEESSASAEQLLGKVEEPLSTSSGDRWGFQRSMVKSMTLAAKVPHSHYMEEINCDALVELKAAFQNENSDPEVKHTYLPFLVKSLSMALSKYPVLNASFIEGSDEVILKGTNLLAKISYCIDCKNMFVVLLKNDNSCEKSCAMGEGFIFAVSNTPPVVLPHVKTIVNIFLKLSSILFNCVWLA